MHIDARELENLSIIEGDICIIGAGIAGISIALEWIDTPYKVILLEGGGFDYDEKVQELYEGKLTGRPYFPLMSSRLHYFGGTSGHWGGMCSTLDDIDFKKRDWVQDSGWPIDHEEISSYYPRSQPILDLGPCEYTVDYWQKKDPLFVPLPFDKDVMWSKIWQFSPPTRFGKKYKETIVNAKNIHLYTYANVVDLNATQNINSIKQVTIKNYANKQHTVRAKYYILACNAIQNARLLLASNKQVPKGLGNANDLVGRYFMEHVEIKSGELWLNNAAQLKLYQRNVKASAEIAISPQKQEELKVLNGTISLMPLEKSKEKLSNILIWSQNDPRKSLKSYVDYKTVPKSFESIMHRVLHSDYYKVFALYTRIEQEPNPFSRVTLNNEIDSLGVPKVNLDWETTPLDKKTVREINKLLGQQVGKAGIGRVKLSDYLLDEKDDTLPSYTSGGWHHIGTTRMSENPKTGVVDKNCSVHGITNLFIAGSSCYPTGGSVNPTLTIVAISLRLSDYLKILMKN
jgi:choline dehydrogenase-like flavoprotein